MGRMRLVAVAIGLIIAASAVIASCSSSSQVGTGGTELARYSFAGSPSEAEQQTTIRVLNARFEVAGVDAQAALVDGAVVLSATTSTPPSDAEIAALAAAGALQFRPVLAVYPPEDQSAIDSTTGGATTPVPGVVVEVPELGNGGSVVARYQLGPVVVDGSALESASTGTNPRGQWEVRPVFKADADGIDRFNAGAALCSPPSARCPTGQLAMTLDDRVLTAPTIQVAEFERDQITISGTYTEQEAKTIAVLMDSGSLPAALVIAH